MAFVFDRRHLLVTPIDWKPGEGIEMAEHAGLRRHLLVTPIDWKPLPDESMSHDSLWSRHLLVTPIDWKQRFPLRIP